MNYAIDPHGNNSRLTTYLTRQEAQGTIDAEGAKVLALLRKLQEDES